MTSAIDAAIAAAKAAGADAAAAAAATAPAQSPTPTPTAGLPASSPMRTSVGAAPTASQMMQGSFSVDSFLKVSEHGMTVGNNSNLIEVIPSVTIDLSDVFYYRAIRYGNPANYFKSTDGVTATNGTPWSTVRDKARAVEGEKFKGDYPSADIPFTLNEEVKDMKGVVVGNVGDMWGKSLSTTEWKEWERMLRKAAKTGVDMDNDVIKVKIGFSPRNNSAGNKWGVLTFEFLGKDD